MIRLDVDGRFFHIQFRHLRRLPPRLAGVSAITTCVISCWKRSETTVGPVALTEFLAIGNTVCDARDNFARRRGRLKAFANALDSCGALVGVKARLWQAYFAIDPDPPPRVPPPKLSDAIKRARWEAGWEIRQKRAARAGLKSAIAGEAAERGTT